jgi:RNA polymerase sigma-70 factor (ECF subfamily)
VDVNDVAARHDELRPLMFSIAYRMLGSVAEAEDVVQEAFLRIHKSALDGTDVDSPDAFATTVTTRLAIDALRSARRRREQYVGPWLPEPLLASDEDPAHRVEMDESVSLAFLVLLETLSPVERAVLVLREVLDYGYAEIAAVVGKSEVNCRQLLTRARRHVEEGAPRFDPSPERRAELSEAFVAALRNGDVDSLERLLAEDVTFYGDGGGKAPAITKPLHGALPVRRFLIGLSRQRERMHVELELTQANGQPAVRLLDADGAVLGIMSLQIADGAIVSVLNQLNPDKLAHLGPVGDLAALARTAG